jgi:uncharacterized protein
LRLDRRHDQPSSRTLARTASSDQAAWRRGKDESEKRRNQQQGEDSSQGQQGSGHRGRGNFAENRERASEAGRKGDKS